jgi:hypothetical protein
VQHHYLQADQVHTLQHRLHIDGRASAEGRILTDPRSAATSPTAFVSEVFMTGADERDINLGRASPNDLEVISL